MSIYLYEVPSLSFSLFVQFAILNVYIELQYLSIYMLCFLSVVCFELISKSKEINMEESFTNQQIYFHAIIKCSILAWKVNYLISSIFCRSPHTKIGLGIFPNSLGVGRWATEVGGEPKIQKMHLGYWLGTGVLPTK